METNRIEALAKLTRLHKEGVLTAEEFAKEKALLLGNVQKRADVRIAEALPPIRAISVAALILIAIKGPAQTGTLPVDPTTGKVTFTGVVQVDSASADVLYERALLWFATTFKSADRALGFRDKDAGIITTSPGTNFPASFVKNNGKRIPNGFITFSLKVQCKDGRFKYTLTDMEHAGTSCDGGALEVENTICFWANLWRSLKQEAGVSAQELISDLTLTLTSRAKADGGDW